MTRVFNAECEAGIVKLNGNKVEPVVILNSGVAKSTGILLLDDTLAIYVAMTLSDLKSLLTITASGLSTVASTFTSISGSLSPPVPSLAASVSSINSIANSLLTLRDNLK